MVNLLYVQGNEKVYNGDVLQTRNAVGVWVDCTILHTPEAARLAYIKTKVPFGALYRIQGTLTETEMRVLDKLRNAIIDARV